MSTTNELTQIKDIFVNVCRQYLQETKDAGIDTRNRTVIKQILSDLTKSIFTKAAAYVNLESSAAAEKADEGLQATVDELNKRLQTDLTILTRLREEVPKQVHDATSKAFLAQMKVLQADLAAAEKVSAPPARKGKSVSAVEIQRLYNASSSMVTDVGELLTILPARIKASEDMVAYLQSKQTQPDSALNQVLAEQSPAAKSKAKRKAAAPKTPTIPTPSSTRRSTRESSAKKQKH